MSLQIRPALISLFRIAPFTIAATIIVAALLFGGTSASAQADPLSTDATLSSLTLSGTTYWHPSFEPDTTWYAVQVGDDVSEITVTATANHFGATVDIDERSSFGWVYSNGTVALDRGRNRVRVEVTAQDTTTTKTYYLLITRTATPPPVITGELSSDDPPVNFRVSGFSHDSISVQWEVPRGRHISEYVLEWHEHNGSEFVSSPWWSGEGEASGGYSVGQSIGNRTPDTLYRLDLALQNDALIPIIEASVTVRTLPEPDPTDATLSNLTLRDIDFGTFDPDTTSYTASVPNSVSNTAIAPTASEKDASFLIVANGVEYPNFIVKVVQLKVGLNTIEVRVTAADGETKKTYTVSVTRAASTEPTPTASPEPTPTSSPEPTSTASPEPTPTASPEPTPTASPEPTPTASPEPTPIPTPACVQSLSGAGEIHGTWNNACLSEKQPLDGSGDRYARFYTFTLTEAAHLTVILKSHEDTYLYLLEGLGKSGETLHEHDDITPGGVDTNSELSLTLQPGEYTIEATTYYAEKSGDFELSIEGLPSAPQPTPAPTAPCVQTIDVQDAIKESWSDTCLSEKPPLSGSGDRYARFYNFTLTEAAHVTVTLASVEDTYLYLRSGSGTGGETLLAHDDISLGTNTNSHIAAKLQPGTYTIEATTYHAEKSGEFTLTVKGLKPDP